MAEKSFQPFVAPESNMKEFTMKALVLGSLFGILFGAATVYLALKAGLTVSASIPIAVIAITLGRRLFKTTILENNIIQTTGSAGESIAAGVVFTLPGFLFLSTAESANYFDYAVIFILAIFGGMLGTLMMIPLRRSLIVKEHETLPYPEGTACASVLKAGERGGEFAKTAFAGLGFAFVYALLQRLFKVIVEAPVFSTAANSTYFPAAQISADITPEYMGVGYIIGPKIAGVLVAGSVLSWLVLNPLLASLIDPMKIAIQQVKLGYLEDVTKAGGVGGWDPATQTFANPATAIYRAYIRLIGAGAVAMGGLITLIKTIPTIISSFKGSVGAVKEIGGESRKRTERDLNIKVVGFGSLALIILISLIPFIPGEGVFSRLLLGVMVVLFGAFFVTVSSRIVGLIGTTNNPISGMTIATIMATCLVFLAVGWGGQAYEAMALVVGGMVCIAAANAGATSQDLKTGFLVGATPKYQQIALFIGAIVSSIAIGFTVKILDTPTPDMIAQGTMHAIGTAEYSAPQATLMATLIKGIQSQSLDWNFVLVGAFLALVVELCGIKALSFAIGVYLPISTTLPIFIGGAVKGIVDARKKRGGHVPKEGEEDLEKGSLFATGLVAGGALMGVAFAIIRVIVGPEALEKFSIEHWLVNSLHEGGYFVLGLIFFAIMGWMLYRNGLKKDPQL